LIDRFRHAAALRRRSRSGGVGQGGCGGLAGSPRSAAWLFSPAMLPAR